MYDYRDLKKYCYFSYLSDAALEAVAKKLFPVMLSAGKWVIKEDEPADGFYLVQEGEVEVFKKTKWGQNAKISVVGHADGFGEMALLTCSPRCCSVQAKTDVKLLKLFKKDFEEIVRLDSAFALITEKHAHSYSQYNQMKTLQPFALLEPEKMAAVMEKLGERKYSKGDDIVVQGENGDVYFIIKSGSVTVLKKMFGDEPEQVATMHEGQGFGEEALITGAPRSATVRALEDTIVWTLSHDEFERVMKESFLQEIAAAEVLGKDQPTYLDVRMQMEYDEEHIPNAVHIPLDELRQRYAELDADRVYHTYCLLGARSAIAAFLINSHGLKAKSIKGGLMNWSGPVEQGINAEGVHAAFTPT